ncbi:hypothetical protein N9Q05_02650 [bacterium]|nr:hypothetical protein [bacterium]
MFKKPSNSSAVADYLTFDMDELNGLDSTLPLDTASNVMHSEPNNEYMLMDAITPSKVLEQTANINTSTPLIHMCSVYYMLNPEVELDQVSEVVHALPPFACLYLSDKTSLEQAKFAICALKEKNWFYLNTNNIHLSNWVHDNQLPLNIGLIIGRNVSVETAKTYVRTLGQESLVAFESFNDLQVAEKIAPIMNAGLYLSSAASDKFVQKISSLISTRGFLYLSLNMPNDKLKIVGNNLKKGRYLYISALTTLESIQTLLNNLQDNITILTSNNMPDVQRALLQLMVSKKVTVTEMSRKRKKETVDDEFFVADEVESNRATKQVRQVVSEDNITSSVAVCRAAFFPTASVAAVVSYPSFSSLDPSTNTSSK